MLTFARMACVALLASAAPCVATSAEIRAESNVPNAQPLAFSARLLSTPGEGRESYVAVAVKADQLSSPAIPRLHIVLVDTSASQIGEHRLQSLEFVNELLARLPETESVRLVAIDVQAESLMEAAAPNSPAAKAALQTLQTRLPLGTTNFDTGLHQALKLIPAGTAASLIYIGDGLSTAEFIGTKELQALVTELQNRKIPFHTYGIGPRLNVPLLGMLALQTGGVMTLDRPSEQQDAPSATEVASRFATGVQQAVLYPQAVQLVTNGSAAQRVELLPAGPLPIRADRESIWLARGDWAADSKFSIHLNGTTPQTVALPAPVERPETATLPAFWSGVKESNGLTNPFAGEQVLTYSLTQTETQLVRLTQQGLHALTRGNRDQAQQILQAAERLVPRHPEVRELATALQQAPQRVTKATPVKFQATKGSLLDNMEERTKPGNEANLLDERDQKVRVMTDKLKDEVQSQLRLANKLPSAEAKGVLQNALDSVKNASEVDPEVREKLQKTLINQILVVSQKIEDENRILIHLIERKATEEAKQRLTDQLLLDQERLQNLIDRVRALMERGRHGDDPAFGEAEDVALVATDLDPSAGVPAAARFNAEAYNQLRRSYRLRERRADKFLEVLHQVELSHVPFPDEPPILYPPAEVWKALTENRKKWANINLRRNSPIEEKIRTQLDKSTEIDFTSTPLQDALDFISDQHQIPIWIDAEALKAEGIALETEVTLKLSGVKLRSALKLLLEPMGVQYLIKDEVMQITTAAKARDPSNLQVRVYGVGDLVIPIAQTQGAGIGQGLGGGGGIGGGGGQFGGGAGGGPGIGGGGGVGGGGAFNVPDPAAVPAKPKPVQPPGAGKPAGGLNDAAVEEMKKKRANAR